MPHHILVPIDGTPLSTRALEFVFTHHPEATVTGIHVQNPSDPSYGAEADLPIDTDDLRRKHYDDQTELVTDHVVREAEAVAAGFDASLETVTRNGDPAREVVEYAEAHDVDHIVMGSHGRTGRDRLLLGSVSEAVVRQSPATVTVVRGD
jgi:nucleotide-binding universal stress UspA family protein